MEKEKVEPSKEEEQVCMVGGVGTILNRVEGKTSLRKYHLNKSLNKLTIWTSVGRTLQAGGTDDAKTLKLDLQGTARRPVCLERTGYEFREIMEDQIK